MNFQISPASRALHHRMLLVGACSFCVTNAIATALLASWGKPTFQFPTGDVVFILAGAFAQFWIYGERLFFESDRRTFAQIPRPAIFLGSHHFESFQKVDLKKHLLRGSSLIRIAIAFAGFLFVAANFESRNLAFLLVTGALAISYSRAHFFVPVLLSCLIMLISALRFVPAHSFANVAVIALIIAEIVAYGAIQRRLWEEFLGPVQAPPMASAVATLIVLSAVIFLGFWALRPDPPDDSNKRGKSGLPNLSVAVTSPTLNKWFNPSDSPSSPQREPSESDEGLEGGTGGEQGSRPGGIGGTKPGTNGKNSGPGKGTGVGPGPGKGNGGQREEQSASGEQQEGTSELPIPKMTKSSSKGGEQESQKSPKKRDKQEKPRKGFNPPDLPDLGSENKEPQPTPTAKDETPTTVIEIPWWLVIVASLTIAFVIRYLFKKWRKKAQEEPEEEDRYAQAMRKTAGMRFDKAVLQRIPMAQTERDRLEQVVFLYNALLEHRAHCGLPKPDPATPDEYARMAASPNPRTNHAMRHVTWVFVRAKYRNTPPTPEDFEAFVQEIRMLGAS